MRAPIKSPAASRSRRSRTALPTFANSDCAWLSSAKADGCNALATADPRQAIATTRVLKKRCRTIALPILRPLSDAVMSRCCDRSILDGCAVLNNVQIWRLVNIQQDCKKILQECLRNRARQAAPDATVAAKRRT